MFKSTFSEAIKVLEIIMANGHQAYIVGGAVRDYLLNKSIDDVDIATSATPTEIQAIFPKVIPVGIEHGTVIVRYNHQSYEVTTFRTEASYSDFRHPDQVEFVASITEDLARRDFTINAMALDAKGKLIDPFQGEVDLGQQLIRAVGHADQRFLEDPLRMMRAIRFVSQLGFELEDATFQAMKQQLPGLHQIALERISVEFSKTIAGMNFQQALQYYQTIGLWDYLPIFCDEPVLINHMDELNRSLPTLYECFAYLKIKESSLDLRLINRAFKQSNQVNRFGEQLVAALTEYQLAGLTNWLVYQLPDSLLLPFTRLCLSLGKHALEEKDLISKKEQLAIKSRSELVLNGKDVISMYRDRSKGAWIESYLSEMEYAVVEDHVANQVTELKEWLRTCHPPASS